MPIYEYVCTACGHEQEALQKMSAPALKTCECCQTDNLKKKVSAAGFRLSGSGWYETDFKNKNQKNLTNKSEAKKDTGENKKTSPPTGSGAKNDSTAPQKTSTKS